MAQRLLSLGITAGLRPWMDRQWAEKDRAKVMEDELKKLEKIKQMDFDYEQKLAKINFERSMQLTREGLQAMGKDPRLAVSLLAKVPGAVQTPQEELEMGQTRQKMDLERRMFPTEEEYKKALAAQARANAARDWEITKGEKVENLFKFADLATPEKGQLVEEPAFDESGKPIVDAQGKQVMRQRLTTPSYQPEESFRMKSIVDLAAKTLGYDLPKYEAPKRKPIPQETKDAILGHMKKAAADIKAGKRTNSVIIMEQIKMKAAAGDEGAKEIMDYLRSQ
ncbi:MAG: hypothetical protein PHV97_00130 [Candidatus Omnitrophica bacterium]|nr:hypothetical protein [Candidatus Omnitrophota bacterium]